MMREERVHFLLAYLKELRLAIECGYSCYSEVDEVIQELRKELIS